MGKGGSANDLSYHLLKSFKTSYLTSDKKINSKCLKEVNIKEENNFKRNTGSYFCFPSMEIFPSKIQNPEVIKENMDRFFKNL